MPVRVTFGKPPPPPKMNRAAMRAMFRAACKKAGGKKKLAAMIERDRAKVAAATAAADADRPAGPTATPAAPDPKVVLAAHGEEQPPELAEVVRAPEDTGNLQELAAAVIPPHGHGEEVAA